ncbi:MAG TPA: 6-hydroxymethylpterin diphosphokinase MptE-like protein [Rectinemataceae bacterium]|nr:6-hydroxymethylpterin diphosphokinase MptE-like protein [Rectinemataceae bacterium]
MSAIVFSRNLLALSGRAPSLGEQLVSTSPGGEYSVKIAKSGALVPICRMGEREISLHSLIDPEREGLRLANAQQSGGFIVALGLGAGYGIMPHLKRKETSGILIIEYKADFLRFILEEFDLSEILADPRVTLLLDPSPEEIGERLLATYIPALAGDIWTLPLRPRTELEPERFAEATDAFREVLGRISDDYSVQAFFGRLWFRNAVRNLFVAERPSSPIRPARRAVVTAAGPSLESGVDAIAAERKAGAVVIATDTSLPALLGMGIKPDLAVSIDCQAISYYHFLKGIPSDVPLVLDLASPNRLARVSPNVRFFSSGHPFCAFLSSRWRPFPALDTSGGNVTHAALSLAEALGAQRTLVVGADFSYPDGKSYARGTYIHDYFAKTSSRLTPAESSFAGFVFRTPAVQREIDVDEAGLAYSRYVTKPLLAYRIHLEDYAAKSRMVIHALRGRGVPIRIEERIQGRREAKPLFTAGAARLGAEAFLLNYARLLAALPLPTEPAAVYLGSLDHEKRDLWTTLLPTAAAFRRASGRDRHASAELLERTRSWALEEIDEALDSH